MSNFSALKTAIQNAIKQNGNEEITGNLLQNILLSIVETMGDSAINTLETDLSNEATTRGDADTQLNNLITGVKNNVDNGYVYAGIATPSTTPVSGKVFYLALTAGTYTNFGATEVPQGINILKYNSRTTVTRCRVFKGVIPLYTAFKCLLNRIYIARRFGRGKQSFGINGKHITTAKHKSRKHCYG